MKLSFIGDVMLGRFVAEKYCEKPYNLVSEEARKIICDADFVIANLESPVVNVETDDSLRFSGRPELLKQFKWVDCFSLSNNHINDFGSTGMSETIRHLKDAGIMQNGLYEDIYKPFIMKQGNEKVALITCADMMNHEFSDDCPYKTLRMNNPMLVFDHIKKNRDNGCFVILFLHAGMLFSRYLNPLVRNFVHSAIDHGAGAVITAHSHCLGGYEIYKDALIINSLGDFLMDGSSFRRRKSCVLNMKVQNGKIASWAITPTITTNGLQTVIPSETETASLLRGCRKVANKIVAHKDDYKSFYKRQYKKEMIQHSMSTLKFELKRRGLAGFLKIIFIRLGDVGGMFKRIVTDRSKMSYDADAVKSISNKAIK